MIEKIFVHNNELNLSLEDKPNIFQINSISLIIGKNGTGKTRVLKSIIEKFKNPLAASLEGTCEFQLSRTARRDINEWGVIYYTPAQNRPKLVSSTNFRDASSKKALSIFDLISHEQVLNEFNIKPEISISVTADAKRISLLLADALIENEKFRPSNIPHYLPLDEAASLLRKSKNLSDFNLSEKDIIKTTAEFQEYRKSIAKYLHEEIENSDRAAKVFSTLSTFTHLVTRKNSSIQFLIEFLTRELNISLITPLSPSTQSKRLDKFHLMSHEIEQIIESTNGTFNKSNSTYTFKTNKIKGKELIERSPAKDALNVDFTKSLSSGQWAIASQMTGIYDALQKISKNRKSILLLIDEGDAFLHLDWQRKYIHQLDNFLNKVKKDLEIETIQLILASHSPLLVSDVPRDFICRLDNNHDHHNDTLSFAAPLQILLNTSFQSKTIGELATRKINSTIENLKKGKLEELDKYIISIVDDPIIRRELHRLVKEKT